MGLQHFMYLTVHEGSNLSAFLLTFVIASFHSCYSSACNVAFHYGFDLHFLILMLLVSYNFLVKQIF